MRTIKNHAQKRQLSEQMPAISRNQVAVVILLGFFLPPVQAELFLNFVPQGAGTIRTNILQGGCMGNITGQTPFLLEGGCMAAAPEIVTDPETGIDYFHMIVGDGSDGFMQETFIEVNALPTDPSLSTTDNNDNAHDPLGMVLSPSETGNGNANPRTVLLRQIVSDGVIMMEFLKDQYLKKPLINQTVSTLEFTSLFQIDMRNSTYEDMNTPGTIFNTVVLSGEDSAAINGNFDMSTDIDKSTFNAGRYTFTDGASNGGTEGTYDYMSSTFDQTAIDWVEYFDPETNNPWGYPARKPD